MRERFIPRLLDADPTSLLNDAGTNLDPHRIWSCMMTNEKPGGHGERSVAVGTIDMAVWDAVAKIDGKPLLPAARGPLRRRPCANPRVFVYAAGGYYHPGKGLDGSARRDARLPRRGYTVVKMKIGGAILADDLRAHRGRADDARPGTASSRSTPTVGSIWTTAVAYAQAMSRTRCSGTRKPAIRSTIALQARARRELRRSDRDRRESVLDAGRAQPDPLRRHATGSGLAAVRLRARATGSSSTCARSTCSASTAGRRAAASRTADTRCRSQSRPDSASAATSAIPDLFQPYGGFPDGVRVDDGHVDATVAARHWLRGQGRPDRRDARAGVLTHQPPVRRTGRGGCGTILHRHPAESSAG